MYAETQASTADRVFSREPNKAYGLPELFVITSYKIASHTKFRILTKIPVKFMTLYYSYFACRVEREAENG